LAIGLCRAIFFESRRFGLVFKFNGYLIFLITSSSSFFEEIGSGLLENSESTNL
jgi:hypothetical protein